ncbi:hypothetical protein CB0940_09776 [Cercospora beticola]|uniref:Uncharacterized protein n=1 Tax=Cercospora beticola TaxID=122368 RepID=A0A2G5HII3_CERBT|nr:hypothetical protein CB0940_09776 [Cercospora beticola]PIA92376.1 hypothetical protein CB0940_09776 [Cercospora beticola]WPB05882.1 hypothetical protein RHO25_010536 [Cercospora beticola]
MPDPRPFASIRGRFDDPPASESSTPRSRRNRLHHALQATADMTPGDMSDLGAPPARPPPPLPPLGRSPRFPMQRRRQRSPGSDDRSTWNEDSAGRRRPKRRRLDSEASVLPKQPIKYGHYGQVEPGKLKLDIVSCDGGEHRDPRHPQTYLGSDNLLRHDKSVYCSDRPSSSIILQHADDTPFCLEKLHICGPEHGFTAPVREGLVYVAMTCKDLSKYMDPPQHARLNGVHTPPYRRRRPRVAPASERITLSDALRDPEVSAALDRERSYADRADAAHDLAGESNNDHDDDYYNFDRQDPDIHCDLPSVGADADYFAMTEDSLPVTLLSDEEPGPEESSSQEVLDFRLHRLRHMRRRYEADNWDRDRARWAGIPREERSNDSWNLRRLDAMMARTNMAGSPQQDELDERDNASQQGPEPGFGPSYYQPPTDDEAAGGTEYYDDGLNDPNVTRARFHIRRGKYKVAIKFDPPVSGRFILLKLWANRSNVDVQSIIAKGYGGARFFPAVDFR